MTSTTTGGGLIEARTVQQSGASRALPPLPVVLLVLLVLGCSQVPPDDEVTTVPQNYQLAGYDLATAVQAILEDVDGQPPAPSLLTATGDIPGTVQVQSDRRGQSALVVGMYASVGVPIAYRVDIVRGGTSLVEGVMPADVLADNDAAPVLLVPIRLDPSTPLAFSFSALPGESPLASTANVTVDVLYASAKAVKRALEYLGEARYWSLYGQKGATSADADLTVQHGGRPTYLHAPIITGGTATVDVSLDGRRLTVPASPIPPFEGQSGRSMLAHEVKDGQVYDAAFSFSVGTLNGWWTWHGPSMPR